MHWANQNTKLLHVTVLKRGKMRACKSWLVLLSLHWKSGASFADQSQREVMQNQSKTQVTFHSQLKTALVLSFGNSPLSHGGHIGYDVCILGIKSRRCVFNFSGLQLMHLSMLSRRGGRQGIGRGFDFFAKNVVKFPTPGLKFCVKSTKKSPPRAPQQWSNVP